MSDFILKIYDFTLLTVGVEGLVMALTLLLLARGRREGFKNLKTGLTFMAVAMIALSVINIVEYAMGIDPDTESRSLSVVTFAASIELFLFLFAYASLLDKNFCTRRRIYTEVALILLFTTPVILVSPHENKVLFHTLFAIGIVFYMVKLAWNIHTYKKYVARISIQMDNYFSDGSTTLMGWVNNTFYMVLSIGVISVVVPLTGYNVLALYNIFIFIAYLYIYAQIIRNMHRFEQNLVAMNEEDPEEPDDPDDPERQEPIVVEEEEKEKEEKEEEPQPKTECKTNQVVAKQAVTKPHNTVHISNEWLARRTYTIPGITAQEVADQLKTNRIKLSIYLHNELHLCFPEWITKLRIEDAKRQLVEHPERSITDIAMSVGIDDRSNFWRYFKQIVGVTPGVYRQENSEKEDDNILSKA